MSKTVQDVMTIEPRTVDVGISIEEAAHHMRRADLREVWVTDDGELRGALTDSDIIVLAIASGLPPSTILAGQSCDAEAPRLHVDQRTDEALDYMRRHNRRHLPVVDQHNHLVGSVWVDDLTFALATSEPAA